MRYQAVLFDLDGTLLDTLADLTDSTNYALRAFGYPERTQAEVCSFVGNGVRKLIERAVPQGCADTDAVYACFRTHYAANCRIKTRVYPGIPALLTALRDAGVKMAVVSNKMDPAVKTLCRDFFAEWISVAIGESAAVRKKPAPDTVREAMRLLGTEDAVYVGDSDVDIETAKNAGLPCISVSWGFRGEDFLRAHGAKQIAADAQELLRALE